MRANWYVSEYMSTEGYTSKAYMYISIIVYLSEADGRKHVLLTGLLLHPGSLKRKGELCPHDGGLSMTEKIHKGKPRSSAKGLGKSVKDNTQDGNRVLLIQKIPQRESEDGDENANVDNDNWENDEIEKMETEIEIE